MKSLCPFAIVIAAGALLTLAWPEPDIAPLAWFAAAPLLITARGGSARRGAALGLVYGLSFFGVLLYWQSLAGWVAWALLVILQSAFIGLFGGAWAIVARRGGPAARIALGACLWVAIEYLRSRVPLGGFTWGELVQSQHDLTWWLRPAAFAGGWVVSLQVMILNGLVAETLVAGTRWRRLPVTAVAALAILAAPLLLPSPRADGAAARLSIVQGNIDPNFTGDFTAYVLDVMQRHRRLTSGLAGRNPDLVVWPESSVALDPLRYEQARAVLTSAARAVRAPLLVGGELDIDRLQRRVVVLQVRADGTIAGFYQKRHRVPFGEYVPMRRYLDWIPILDQIAQDAVPGRAPKIFELAGGDIATVISFEGDFGSLVRASTRAGGRLLVVATNTSTFGFTWNSAQHVAFSQIRAVENGTWVAHAALTGISAFIRPNGTIAASTELWTPATLTQDVHFSGGATFYARTGDWLPLGCSIVAVVALAIGVVRHRVVRSR